MKAELKFLIRRFLKDKRGIEGMPMKYLIIMLIAAVVIGIVAYMLVTLKAGTVSSVNKINQTMTEQINKSLNALNS